MLGIGRELFCTGIFCILCYVGKWNFNGSLIFFKFHRQSTESVVFGTVEDSGQSHQEQEIHNGKTKTINWLMCMFTFTIKVNNNNNNN